ncbi:MAG: nucleoside hydrolase [Clostridia bacterium]|nr:nucleoside hydrolase [Clostridia bacterium]
MDNEKKPVIIFDTDMDTDCDDAGALAMLLEAHLQNKIELIGMVSDSVCAYAAPCCEAIAQSYGVSVPVGTLYVKDYAEAERFDAYRAHSAKCARESRDYNRVFAEQIDKTDQDYPSAVSVYRKLLAQAEDESVTMLCVGMLTAIAETLKTKADDISPLSGVELFRKKVKKVITMGNPEKVNDFNWGMDAQSTKTFFELCPVPIYISAQGKTIVTGAHLGEFLEADHPVRQAYSIWLGAENTGRASWDLIASLYAIHPDTPHLKCHDFGKCSYDTENKVTLVEKVHNSPCKTLHITCTDEQMTEILNDCMLGAF